MNLELLIYLAGPAVWAIVFSMFNKRPLRGFRNFGILGSYVAGVWLLASKGWRAALPVWLVFAIVAALAYLAYEVVAWRRSKADDAKPSFKHFVVALLAWPIMLPEATEYLLAELGVLRPIKPAPPTTSVDPTKPGAG